MTAAIETSLRTLSGWGRTTPATVQVSRPKSAATVTEILRTWPHVIARGMGRSYGDAAQCSGGLTLDMLELGTIGAFDQAVGTIELGAGVTLHELMRYTIPAGWFPAVTPGTRYVSIGGAIAADVHGKNHHRDGSFARHVSEMQLATPTGLHTLTPEDKLFWATAGGMGLTGVIVSATVRLIPIETTWMQVDNERFGRMHELMTAMESSDHQHRYSVAWLDCLSRHEGGFRSILTRGDHVPIGSIPDRLRGRTCEIPQTPKLRIPRGAPRRLVNGATVRLLNEAWFRASSRSRKTLSPLTAFFHPLDGVENWSFLYGPAGFVQYQFVVPPPRRDVVEDAVATISDSGIPSFLAVLKRFGPGTTGPLSFSQEGWTLALDFPIGPRGLPQLLDRLDQSVADAGGRVYLAKDARLRPDLLPRMFPRLQEMREVCRVVDPQRILASDLSRRLGVLG